jgi:hypothetical protein
MKNKKGESLNSNEEKHKRKSTYLDKLCPLPIIGVHLGLIAFPYSVASSFVGRVAPLCSRGRTPGRLFISALDCSGELQCLRLSGIRALVVLTCFPTCGGPQPQNSHVVLLQTGISHRFFKH